MRAGASTIKKLTPFWPLSEGPFLGLEWPQRKKRALLIGASVAAAGPRPYTEPTGGGAPSINDGCSRLLP
jgi:hypothetical protein